MSATRNCTQCGASVALDSPQGLCPQCLLKQGLTDSGSVNSDQSSVDKTVLESPSDRPTPGAVPREGQRFGDYQLVRPLGQGGMGTVYEAEHLPTERRVALKILNHELNSPEARKRFLREGQLAASINHPNSVYIFGTEEIEGVPVIAMELAPGGTLKDRVKEHGPSPITEAVDAVLQMIAGLEAAQRQGVLHRDIKPSNCFVDADGTVKVGDFGLSISTLARADTQLTTTGRILGTPAFASPEQLRGDELDVRSDIYSVGVTLYYLLTGKVPFEETNLVRLVTMVVERQPAAPAKLRPEIPQGLAQVILRCLAKQAAKRFAGYEELSHTLAPFGSTAAGSAPLGVRFLAGLTDFLLLGVMLELWFRILPHSALINALFGDLGYSPLFSWQCLIRFLPSLLLVIAYFTLLEGCWGTTVGKAVLGLRVVGPTQSGPGLSRALLRAAVLPAAIFSVPSLLPWLSPSLLFQLPTLMVWRVGHTEFFATLAAVCFAFLPFTTCRRRNGFAAWHDLATQTRVVLKSSQQDSLQPAHRVETLELDEATPKIGPYHVLSPLGCSASAEMFLGYDVRLRRSVWIRKLPEGMVELSACLQSLGRATRLRWLNGKRSPGQNWDAYEAPTGHSLLQLMSQPQSWKQVRVWLADLAEELRAAQKTDWRPSELALDRVWITEGGGAKLLDFPAPNPMSDSRDKSVGTDRNPSRRMPESHWDRVRRLIFERHFAVNQPTPEPLPGGELATGARQEAPLLGGVGGGFTVPMRGNEPRSLSNAPDATQLFLKQIALAALEGSVVGESELKDRLPQALLPLHARDWLIRLAQASNLDAVLRDLRSLQGRFTTVSRGRRLAMIVGCWLLPLISLRLAGTSNQRTLDDDFDRIERSSPELMGLDHGLEALRSIASDFPRGKLPKLDELRRLEGFRALALDEKQRLDLARSLEISMAGLCGPLLTNKPVWESEIVGKLVWGAERGRVERIVATYTNLTRDQVVQALKIRWHSPFAQPSIWKREFAVPSSSTSSGSKLVLTAPVLPEKAKEEALFELARDRWEVALFELIGMMEELRLMDDLPDRFRKWEKMELYLAGRFGGLVTNKSIWEGENARFLFRSDSAGRQLIERMVATHRNVTAQELAEATAAAGPMLVAARKAYLHRPKAIKPRPTPLPFLFCQLMTVLVAVPSLIGAALFRGGILIHGLGVAVVTPNGVLASRRRVLWRAALTWSLWLGVVVAIVAPLTESGPRSVVGFEADPWCIGGLLLAFCLASLLSLRNPAGGLADSLAGTRLVPK